LARFGRSNETLTAENLLVQMGYTYFRVPEGLPLQELEGILNHYYTEVAQEPGKDINLHLSYRAQPLTDTHIDAGLGSDRPTVNPLHLFSLSAIAFLIVLVACINYTNLATARATRRAKEIGVRKVVGAG